jgi:hypothetical protein
VARWLGEVDTLSVSRYVKVVDIKKLFWIEFYVLNENQVHEQIIYIFKSHSTGVFNTLQDGKLAGYIYFRNSME